MNENDRSEMLRLLQMLHTFGRETSHFGDALCGIVDKLSSNTKSSDKSIDALSRSVSRNARTFEDLNYAVERNSDDFKEFSLRLRKNNKTLYESFDILNEYKAKVDSLNAATHYNISKLNLFSDTLGKSIKDIDANTRNHLRMMRESSNSFKQSMASIAGMNEDQMRLFDVGDISLKINSFTASLKTLDEKMNAFGQYSHVQFDETMKQLALDVIKSSKDIIPEKDIKAFSDMFNNLKDGMSVDVSVFQDHIKNLKNVSADFKTIEDNLDTFNRRVRALASEKDKRIEIYQAQLSAVSDINIKKDLQKKISDINIEYNENVLKSYNSILYPVMKGMNALGGELPKAFSQQNIMIDALNSINTQLERSIKDDNYNRFVSFVEHLDVGAGLSDDLKDYFEDYKNTIVDNTKSTIYELESIKKAFDNKKLTVDANVINELIKYRGVDTSGTVEKIVEAYGDKVVKELFEKVLSKESSENLKPLVEQLKNVGYKGLDPSVRKLFNDLTAKIDIDAPIKTTEKRLEKNLEIISNIIEQSNSTNVGLLESFINSNSENLDAATKAILTNGIDNQLELESIRKLLTKDPNDTKMVASVGGMIFRQLLDNTLKNDNKNNQELIDELKNIGYTLTDIKGLPKASGKGIEVDISNILKLSEDRLERIKGNIPTLESNFNTLIDSVKKEFSSTVHEPLQKITEGSIASSNKVYTEASKEHKAILERNAKYYAESFKVMDAALEKFSDSFSEDGSMMKTFGKIIPEELMKSIQQSSLALRSPLEDLENEIQSVIESIDKNKTGLDKSTANALKHLMELSKTLGVSNNDFVQSMQKNLDAFDKSFSNINEVDNTKFNQNYEQLSGFFDVINKQLLDLEDAKTFIDISKQSEISNVLSTTIKELIDFSNMIGYSSDELNILKLSLDKYENRIVQIGKNDIKQQKMEADALLSFSNIIKTIDLTDIKNIKNTIKNNVDPMFDPLKQQLTDLSKLFNISSLNLKTNIGAYDDLAINLKQLSENLDANHMKYSMADNRQILENITSISQSLGLAEETFKIFSDLQQLPDTSEISGAAVKSLTENGGEIGKLLNVSEFGDILNSLKKNTLTSKSIKDFEMMLDTAEHLGQTTPEFKKLSQHLELLRNNIDDVNVSAINYQNVADTFKQLSTDIGKNGNKLNSTLADHIKELKFDSDSMNIVSDALDKLYHSTTIINDEFDNSSDLLLDMDKSFTTISDSIEKLVDDIGKNNNIINDALKSDMEKIVQDAAKFGIEHDIIKKINDELINFSNGIPNIKFESSDIDNLKKFKDHIAKLSELSPDDLEKAIENQKKAMNAFNLAMYNNNFKINKTTKDIVSNLINAYGNFGEDLPQHIQELQEKLSKFSIDNIDINIDPNIMENLKNDLIKQARELNKISNEEFRKNTKLSSITSKALRDYSEKQSGSIIGVMNSLYTIAKDLPKDIKNIQNNDALMSDLFAKFNGAFKEQIIPFIKNMYNESKGYLSSEADALAAGIYTNREANKSLSMTEDVARNFFLNNTELMRGYKGDSQAKFTEELQNTREDFKKLFGRDIEILNNMQSSIFSMAKREQMDTNDIRKLLTTIDKISHAYGLTPQQVEQMVTNVEKNSEYQKISMRLNKQERLSRIDNITKIAEFGSAIKMSKEATEQYALAVLTAGENLSPQEMISEYGAVSGYEQIMLQTAKALGIETKISQNDLIEFAKQFTLSPEFRNVDVIDRVSLELYKIDKSIKTAFTEKGTLGSEPERQNISLLRSQYQYQQTQLLSKLSEQSKNIITTLQKDTLNIEREGSLSEKYDPTTIESITLQKFQERMTNIAEHTGDAYRKLIETVSDAEKTINAWSNSLGGSIPTQLASGAMSLGGDILSSAVNIWLLNKVLNRGTTQVGSSIVTTIGEWLSTQLAKVGVGAIAGTVRSAATFALKRAGWIGLGLTAAGMAYDYLSDDVPETKEQPSSPVNEQSKYATPTTTEPYRKASSTNDNTSVNTPDTKKPSDIINNTEVIPILNSIDAKLSTLTELHGILMVLNDIKGFTGSSESYDKNTSLNTTTIKDFILNGQLTPSEIMQAKDAVKNNTKPDPKSS